MEGGDEAGMGVVNDTTCRLFYSELLILLGGSNRQTVRVAFDEVAVLAGPAVLLPTHKHCHALNTIDREFVTTAKKIREF